MKDDDAREDAASPTGAPSEEDEAGLPEEADGPDGADEADGADLVDEPDGWDATDEEWVATDSRERPRPVPLAVAAALVGAVVMLNAVLAWNAVSDGDDRVASAAEADPAPVSATGSQAPDETEASVTKHGATRLSRCTAAVRALEEPLAAAGPALDQWSVHVGAMNKLVVGEITLQQATDFWDDTRVGAKRNMARFRDAMTSLRRHGIDCPAPVLLAPGAKALPACSRRVQAELTALRAARTALATWDVHIHHMDMLRLGQMSPEEATTMWLASWQQGVHEIDDYEAASRAATREDGCLRAHVEQ